MKKTQNQTHPRTPSGITLARSEYFKVIKSPPTQDRQHSNCRANQQSNAWGDRGEGTVRPGSGCAAPGLQMTNNDINKINDISEGHSWAPERLPLTPHQLGLRRKGEADSQPLPCGTRRGVHHPASDRRTARGCAFGDGTHHCLLGPRQGLLFLRLLLGTPMATRHGLEGLNSPQPGCWLSSWKRLIFNLQLC